VEKTFKIFQERRKSSLAEDVPFASIISKLGQDSGEEDSQQVALPHPSNNASSTQIPSVRRRSSASLAAAAQLVSQMVQVTSSVQLASGDSAAQEIPKHTKNDPKLQHPSEIPKSTTDLPDNVHSHGDVSFVQGVLKAVEIPLGHGHSAPQIAEEDHIRIGYVSNKTSSHPLQPLALMPHTVGSNYNVDDKGSAQSNSFIIIPTTPKVDTSLISGAHRISLDESGRSGSHQEEESKHKIVSMAKAAAALSAIKDMRHSLSQEVCTPTGLHFFRPFKLPKEKSPRGKN
jgi:hypothetical protein